MGKFGTKVAQMSALCLCAALLASTNLCISLSKENGRILYQSLSVTLLVESLKFALCLGGQTFQYLNSGSSRSSSRLTWRESLVYSVPAFLYMVDNNLAFVILRQISPARLAVLWNLKILSTAALLHFGLKRQLTKLQKLAILLLICGVLTTTDQKHATLLHPTNSTNNTSSRLDLNLICLIGIGVIISSLAGVYSEWALKRRFNTNFFLQSLHLYSYGICLNLLTLLVQQKDLTTFFSGFFTGYNIWTWLTIILNSAAGMSIGVLYKYLDNMAAVYAHALSMILTMVVSFFFLDFQPTLQFVAGVGVSIISMYLYYMEPEQLLLPPTEAIQYAPVPVPEEEENDEINDAHSSIHKL